MPSKFDEIDAAAQAVIEDRMGEPMQFIGMVGGDYSRAEDPARPAQTATAMVAVSPRVGLVADGIQGQRSSSTSRAYSSNELWMSAAEFSALDWVPKKDDKVVIRPGEAGEREFTVSGVYPMDHDDVQIILAEGGRDA